MSEGAPVKLAQENSGRDRSAIEIRSVVDVNAVETSRSILADGTPDEVMQLPMGTSFQD